MLFRSTQNRYDTNATMGASQEQTFHQESIDNQGSNSSNYTYSKSRSQTGSNPYQNQESSRQHSQDYIMVPAHPKFLVRGIVLTCVGIVVFLLTKTSAISFFFALQACIGIALIIVAKTSKRPMWINKPDNSKEHCNNTNQEYKGEYHNCNDPQNCPPPPPSPYYERESSINPNNQNRCTSDHSKYAPQRDLSKDCKVDDIQTAKENTAHDSKNTDTERA